RPPIRRAGEPGEAGVTRQSRSEPRRVAPRPSPGFTRPAVWLRTLATHGTQEAVGDMNDTTELTDGFHLVVDALKLNGVDTIFGVAGIPITDLLRLAQNEGIRYLGFRHEQSAGNAAAIAGYLTQKPGICMTVSAPGFLNGLVALANATTNCFPMILISGSSD